MILSSFRVSLAVGAILVLSAPATAGPPTQSIDQLIRGMTDFDARFDPAKHSFLIHYREDTTSFDKEGKPVPKFNRWVEGTFARKGKMLLNRVKLKLAQSPSVEEEIMAWRDGVCVQRKRDGLNILPYLPAQARGYTAYTQSLGLDVYRLLEWTSPSEGAEHPFARSLTEEYFWVLPRIVTENRKQYRLRPALEEIDGDWCHVLEWAGHDIIWLDTQHGYMVRKRVLQIDNGVPLAEYRNHKPQQVRPGLWLPAEQSTTRYYNPSERGKEFAGKVKYKDAIRLITARFDDLADDTFTVPVKPDENLLIADSIRKMTYIRHADGVDPLTEALVDAQANHPRSARKKWLLINGILFGGLSCGLLAWRLRRAPATDSKPPVTKA